MRFLIFQHVSRNGNTGLPSSLSEVPLTPLSISVPFALFVLETVFPTRPETSTAPSIVSSHTERRGKNFLLVHLPLGVLSGATVYIAVPQEKR